MADGGGNFFKNIITRHVDRRADEYAEKYGKNPDGSPNAEFAALIQREVHRRGGMGLWLDVVEPVFWAVVSLVPTVAAAIGLNWAKDKQRPTYNAWKFAFLTTTVNSVIQLIRIPVRYDFGLRGGVESARVIEEARAQGGITLSPAAPAPSAAKAWEAKVKKTGAETAQQLRI